MIIFVLPRLSASCKEIRGRLQHVWKTSVPMPQAGESRHDGDMLDSAVAEDSATPRNLKTHMALNSLRLSVYVSTFLTDGHSRHQQRTFGKASILSRSSFCRVVQLSEVGCTALLLHGGVIYPLLLTFEVRVCKDEPVCRMESCVQLGVPRFRLWLGHSLMLFQLLSNHIVLSSGPISVVVPGLLEGFNVVSVRSQCSWGILYLLSDPDVHHAYI